MSDSKFQVHCQLLMGGEMGGNERGKSDASCYWAQTTKKIIKHISFVKLSTYITTNMRLANASLSASVSSSRLTACKYPKCWKNDFFTFLNFSVTQHQHSMYVPITHLFDWKTCSQNSNYYSFDFVSKDSSKKTGYSTPGWQLGATGRFGSAR